MRLPLVICCMLLGAARGLMKEDKQPHFLFALVGGHAVFNCPLDFPYNIEIPYILHWRKDGEIIYSWDNNRATSVDTFAGRVSLLSTGERGWGRASINLTAIRETDDGWYHCKVIFPNRTPNSLNNGTWFHLEVDGGNLIAIPPVNISVMEGEEAVFQCLIKQPESLVRWYKDSDAIADLPDLSHRSTLNSDGSLTIAPTVMSDLGEYSCEVTNSISERQSASAFLNVTYKAKVIYAPREVYLPYGRNATLDCHFRANPPLTNLRWEKDGFLFDPYNVQGVFYIRNGSLYFDRVDETHAGQYSCTPFNALGTAGASPTISARVQRPPAWARAPPPVRLARLGQPVQLYCDADDGEADQKASILWTRKDGRPLPEGRHSVRGGNLSITHVQEADRGLYTCAAANAAATITADTELLIENAAPRPPYNLTATPGHDSITLSWSPGYTRPNVEYNVWYRSVDTTEWKTMRILSKKTTTATINDLVPGIEYEVMVLCEDKDGEGRFSKVLRVRTKHGSSDNSYDNMGVDTYTAIGPPQNVTVLMTPEGYLVTWTPPEYGVEGLRTYVVKWYLGADEYLAGSQETINTYMLIRSLAEDEVYTFQVFSMSTNDYQTASERVLLTVPAYTRIHVIVAITSISFILILICASVLYFKKSKMREAKNQKDLNCSNGRQC